MAQIFPDGMIVIDQARMDYIAHVLNNKKLMEGIIGIANIADLPLPASIGFARRENRKIAAGSPSSRTPIVATP